MCVTLKQKAEEEMKKTKSRRVDVVATPIFGGSL